MKLVRYGAFGSEKPGLIDKDGKLRDLSGQIKDLADDAFAPANLAKLAALDPASLPAVSGSPRIGSPVGGKPKFIAIGLNYADHAAESNMPIPSEPIVFMKALNSLCGPNDDVEKPRGSTKLDWEVELAIVIGTKAKYVTEADALKHVADFVWRHQPWAERAECVVRLALGPLAAALDLEEALRNVVADGVAGHMLQRIGFRDVFGFAADDDGEFDFPIELGGAAWLLHIVIRAAQ